MYKNKQTSLLILRGIKNKFAPEVYDKVYPKYPVDFYAFPMIFYHNCRKLMDQNTRYISIEGNLGTNKAYLGRKLADYFNMKYVDDADESMIYKYRLGNFNFDLKAYNKALPYHAQPYDIKKLFCDEDPIKNGKPLFLQKYLLMWRYFNTCKALSHLFNTSQGFVQKRSPWFDNAMAQTLHQMGLMSDIAYKYYDLQRCEILPFVYKPHIVVFLKASPKLIRAKLEKENRWEANARNLTDEFLERYEENFMNIYNKVLYAACELLVVDLETTDIENECDFLSVADEISNLNHNYELMDSFNRKFYEWREETGTINAYNKTRKFYSYAYQCYRMPKRMIRVPFAVTEGIYTYEERDEIEYVLFNDDRFTYDVNFDTKFTNFMDTLWCRQKMNYYKLENTPQNESNLEFIFHFPHRI